MIQRILDAWLTVTEMRAEADIEVARIDAKTRRWIARLAAGHIKPPEERPPEMDDPELRRVVEWAEERYGAGPLADDIIGMWRSTRRGKLPPDQRAEVNRRLTNLGFPGDW